MHGVIREPLTYNENFLIFQEKNISVPYIELYIYTLIFDSSCILSKLTLYAIN